MRKKKKNITPRWTFEKKERSFFDSVPKYVPKTVRSEEITA